MDAMDLLIDLHGNANRQGPGSDQTTQQAIQLAELDGTKPLTIADIGCGTGASSIVLAKILNKQRANESAPNTHITAVDFLQPFLDSLTTRVTEAGFSEAITPLCASMDALPFDDGSFDVLWSEGAIYNIGFQAGIEAWRRYLKPGGVLVVSEITWLTDSRPEAIETYWNTAYPEINTASTKIGQLERHGYSPIGYFTLPESCWLDEYYRPIQKRLDDFLQRHDHSADAQAIAEQEREEIALYEQYKDYYSYGVYIARKSSEQS